jgi:hypothetical protein
MSLSQQEGPEDLGAVALEKSLLQDHRSGLTAPGQSLLTETKDAAALDSCLGFSAAVTALLHKSSLEVIVPALLDVYLEGDGPEPRQSSLTQTGLVLIHLPAAMVAATSDHLPQSSFLAALIRGPTSLGDSSDPNPPCVFLRAMSVDVTGAYVPDHRAEDFILT